MEPIRRDEWPLVVVGALLLVVFGIWGILLAAAVWGTARLGRRFGERLRPFYAHHEEASR
jgi:hypothetical protein